jgi:hypothetical protein
MAGSFILISIFKQVTKYLATEQFAETLGDLQSIGRGLDQGVKM